MNNEKILIVEDEKIIALDLQRRLERFGYTVVGMAGEGETAVELARQAAPDIILMDISLAGTMDGIEAAGIIRKQLGLPVIFLTAYADEKTLERAKEVEPYGYILKPLKERELYTTIDIALYKYGIEKRLRKQERLFSAILHSINEGIIATDMNLNVQFMNTVAEEITGYKEEAVKGACLPRILTLFDPRTQKDILSGGFPLVDERPYFFHELSIKNTFNQNILVDGSITRIHEKENATEGYLLALRDITEMKRMSETINYQASHDILTGLSNREELAFKLGEVLKSIQQTGENHGLLILDIDRFKAVNDTCGALAGDELLRQVASHIQANIQRNDISARIGGDEFACILMHCAAQDAFNVAKRLQEAAANRKFIWQGTVFPVTLSIGIVPLTRESGDIHAVLAAGDDACHLAKESGGNKISIFQVEDTVFQRRRGEMEWIGKINRAIDENRFLLYYQPIVPLDPVKGYSKKIEILIRLVNEDGGIARPGDFIPSAERYNLMPQIDRWVIENAMRAFRTLRDRKNPLADSIFSINLSGPSLLDETLIDKILSTLAQYSLPASSFCFEITETAAIQNLSYASRFMKRLKEEGFTFALDDFGSGFSSFGYLKNLPVDYLKIDGSFVQSIDESLVSCTMVESINSVGHVMGLRTIGEFVKSDKIWKKLVELGVDYGQGYIFAEPRPLLSDPV